MSNILVIGDVMLDKYSYGDVRRLNPEGPNPLINISQEEYRLGGAGNVALNTANLNGTCNLIGLVGNDNNEEKFLDIVKKYNINFKKIIVENFKTIIKQRFIEKTYNQQLLRIDYEDKLDKNEHENILKKISTLLSEKKYDIIILSDYNKGIVFEELINYIKKCANKVGSKIICDIKPKNIKYFKDVYLIKPNFKEFCEMIGKEIKNTNEDIEKYGKNLVEKMNSNIIITRGSKGASLITKDKKILHIPTEAQKIFDVTGAGDTFIATIAYALSNNLSLQEAIKLGNKASGIVIGKIGTATILKKEILN